MPHRVEFVKAPATTVAVVRFHVLAQELPRIGERMSEAFGTVAAELGKARITPDGPAVASYEPADDGFDVAAGFRVPGDINAPRGLERLELGDVETAHTTHVGPYSDLPTAYADLRTRAEAAGRALSRDRPMWEEYWSEPGTPDSQTRTEIFWPVSPVG